MVSVLTNVLPPIPPISLGEQDLASGNSITGRGCRGRGTVIPILLALPATTACIVTRVPFWTQNPCSKPTGVAAVLCSITADRGQGWRLGQLMPRSVPPRSILVVPQYICLLIPNIFELFGSVCVQIRGVPVLLVQEVADSSTSTWTWWLCPLWAPMKGLRAHTQRGKEAGQRCGPFGQGSEFDFKSRSSTAS